MQYDIRNAEKARSELNSRDFNGRIIDIHYSLPKAAEDPTISCSRSSNQVRSTNGE